MSDTYEYDGITYLDGDTEQAALAEDAVVSSREVRDDFRLTVAALPDGHAIVIDASLWDDDRAPAPGPAPEGINLTICAIFTSVGDAQAWADREYAAWLTPDDSMGYERPDITIAWDENHRAGLLWDGGRRASELWSSHGQDVERATAAAAQDGDLWRLAVVDGEHLGFAEFADRDTAILALVDAAERIADGLAAGELLDQIGAERMRELAAEQRQGVHRRRLVTALKRAKAERIVDRYGQLDNAALARRLRLSPQAVGKMLRADD